ncbi:hypothetical protein WG68_11875 [Arsukibacterium ikkense]|uniref:DUF4398 domain-containing protein n=2 Tax=Arsukibacterium ikkense TaxID=336831 RepID=A0A0M2V7T0_9GAMM|nr:hypothetical protein WG68_11875 [Arsukibacterium ikkense]
MLAQRAMLLASMIVLLAGCAAAPQPPSAELEAAERAISVTERAQVTRYTSVELDTARQELAGARQALLAENMPQAARLALQAQLSAELAMAKAELLKAREVNQDMQQSIEAVRQEAQRNQSGVKP